MKFKVGQKVRMVEDNCDARVGDIGIIRALPKGEHSYTVEFPCFKERNCGHYCDGLVPSGNGHWIVEDQMELASEQEGPMTLKDKLELFKAGTHVLHVPTQEIYDKLMVELEKRGLALVGNGHLKGAKKLWSALGKYTCVLYVHSGCHCGTKGYYVADGKEVITLTLEDFKGNKQEDYMKITIETDGHYKTTAECNGITTESLCNPTDEFKLSKGVHMAVQRLLERLEEPEEDTVFHVGDIVEVVANEFNFEGDPIGLQGVVTSSVTIGAAVKIPIYKSPMHFYNRELKLIRRGNN